MSPDDGMMEGCVSLDDLKVTNLIVSFFNFIVNQYKNSHNEKDFKVMVMTTFPIFSDNYLFHVF